MTRQQVSTPRLNFDVLVNLFAYMGRNDISSIMKTCKTLYRPAIPDILDGGVMILSIRKATSFSSFMRPSHWNEDRNCYLSHLHICVQFLKEDKDAAFAFAKTIQHAVHLKELQMDSVDWLLTAGGTKVLEALRDLSSHHKLKKLAVQDIQEDAVRLLGAIVSSSITDLSLSYLPEMDSPDPFPALRSLWPIITTLNLVWVDLGSRTVQCPLLHTLSLYTHYPVTTSVLIFAFPNLLRLSLCNEFDDFTEDDLIAVRQSNWADLEPPHSSWTHLRRLDGDTAQLYAMGLSCHVHELSVDGVTITDVPMLLRLFDDLSPQMVELEIYLTSFSVETLEDFLRTTTQFPNNRCSHLSLNVRWGESQSDIQEFMSMLVSILRQATVCLFGLQIQHTRKTEDRYHLLEEVQHTPTTEAIPIEADSSRDQETIESAAARFSSNVCDRWTFDRVNAPDPVGEYLESMDIQAFALQVAQQVPTLGHIGVYLSEVRTSQIYWKVIRSSESTQVSLLNVGNFCDGRQRFWRASEEMEE